MSWRGPGQCLVTGLACLSALLKRLMSAAVAGLMQQLMGAVGGFSVGLLPAANAGYLAILMLGFALIGVTAQSRLGKNPPPAGPTQVM